MEAQPARDWFAGRFSRWGITLPEDSTEGEIHQAGWFIRYRWIELYGETALEFYAAHRMTNDTLYRIHADGSPELLGAAVDFSVSEFDDTNQRFAALLKERGW